MKVSYANLVRFHSVDQRLLTQLKLLFEVPSRVSNSAELTFAWLKHDTDVIFVQEAGVYLKILSTDRDRCGQLKEVNLTEKKTCTNFSLNKDDQVFALVIDFRQIFIWNLVNSSFTHFKPTILRQSANLVNGGKKLKQSNIDWVIWSKVSEKLAICFETGLIHLCDFSSSPPSEIALDHSDGVLKRVSSISACEGANLFVCCTIISEVLVATFDGELKYYIASSNLSITQLSLAPELIQISFKEKRKAVWLTYQIGGVSLQFKLINLEDKLQDTKAYSSELEHSLVESDDKPGMITHVSWLNSTQLITCSSSGRVDLYSLTVGEDLKFETLLKLELKENAIAFEIGPLSDPSCKSLAIGTKDEIFYFELNIQGAYRELSSCHCELIDNLDLRQDLEKIKTTIKCIKWSKKGSLMAVQLATGNTLIYRARLDNQVVAHNQSRVAYLSGPEEILVLDFESSLESTSKEKASIINVEFKPTLVAISQCQVAVALNNRVRFYTIGKTNSKFFEHEYNSIVTSLALNQRYVAVHLNDGRLKLHTIGNGTGSSYEQDFELDQQRYFPDPLKPEKISTFTLCDRLLVYATYELSINIFCLIEWTTVQTYDYSSFARPIIGIRTNLKANKMVCILAKSTNNVFLYDLFSNDAIVFEPRVDEIYSQMSASHFDLWDKGQRLKLAEESAQEVSNTRSLGIVLEALWDADGRAVSLFDRTHFHTFVVLDHTLAREGPSIELVASWTRAISLTPLYSSQGIIAFQTRTGRVTNMVVDVYDDEANLSRFSGPIESEARDKLDAGASLMWPRVKYLQSALKVYSLPRAAQICETLASSLGHPWAELLWRQLAIRSVFLMNLEYGRLVCVRHEIGLLALLLERLLNEMRRHGVDSKSVIKKRLLTMLN